MSSRGLAQRKVELGGAVVSLRQRGYLWADIADALGLADEREARQLATRFLLANADERGADGPTKDRLPR